MPAVTGYASVEQLPEPEHGHVGCAVCGAVAQALEGEGADRANDWVALGQWSRDHAATHTDAEHRKAEQGH